MKPTSMDSTNITMDSLALPKELYWDGKSEPTSPSSSNVFSIFAPVQNWELFENNFANEYWNDSKLHSPPQYIDYTLGDIIINSLPVIKVQSAAENEVFGTTTFATSTLSQLTPPQSPPRTAAAIQGSSPQQVINVNDVIAHHQASLVSPTHSSSSRISSNQSEHFGQYAWNTNTLGEVATTFIEEIERETQIVDEILKSRAKELIDWNDDSESMSSSSPPSLLSFDEECLSSSPFTGSSSSPNSSPVHVSETDYEKSISAVAFPKKRTRTYGRGLEDRKIRKKEQNKNAATRYRQKKKQEMELVLSEEQQLNNRNEELKKILTDRNREAKYLKTLIREFYKKK